MNYGQACTIDDINYNVFDIIADTTSRLLALPDQYVRENSQRYQK